MRREDNWRVAGLTRLAKKLGVENESLVTLSQKTAETLNLGDESMAAKKEALRLEAHRVQSELIRSGQPPAPQLIRDGVFSGQLGRQIAEALTDDCTTCGDE